jgi:hypothetical protein
MALRGLPEVEWLAIGRAYEEGASPTALCRQYEISLQALYQQRKQRGWVRPNRRASNVQADVDTATTAKLVGEFNHADLNHGINHAGEDEGYAEAVEGAADLRVGIIQRHRTAWSEIRELERMAFQAALDPDWVPPGDEPGHPLPFGKRIEYATSLAKLYKQHSEQLVTAQEGERRANGFDYKLQQAETKPPEDPEISAKRVQGLKDLIAGIHDLARQRASHPSSPDTGDLTG